MNVVPWFQLIRRPNWTRLAARPGKWLVGTRKVLFYYQTWRPQRSTSCSKMNPLPIAYSASHSCWPPWCPLSLKQILHHETLRTANMNWKNLSLPLLNFSSFFQLLGVGLYRSERTIPSVKFQSTYIILLYSHPVYLVGELIVHLDTTTSSWKFFFFYRENCANPQQRTVLSMLSPHQPKTSLSSSQITLSSDSLSDDKQCYRLTMLWRPDGPILHTLQPIYPVPSNH